MCIVIDTNVIGIFLDPNNADSEPVRKWLKTNKNAKIVFGGSKYLAEIKKANKEFHVRYLLEMRKLNKVINSKKLDDEIDEEQARIEQIETNPDFDDPHLIAIINMTGCKLIFSNDDRFFPYLRKKELLKRERPKIYYNRRNQPLLSDKYIADCCKSHP